MKKITKALLLTLSLALVLTGCKKESAINVVSRETGSGTRSAFVEIIGLLEKSDGQEKDLTYEEAVIQNTTDGVITTVEGDKDAIGYISTGSLNDRVKALAVDTVRPSRDNVKDSSYEISRPFLLAYKDDLDPLEEDFLSFVLSQEGQDLVENNSFIAIDPIGSYRSTKPKGKLVISGSTSVTPLMEKIKESYEELNREVSIEIQSNGSSTGIQSALDGSSNFAMASRELKDEEKSALKSSVISMDGIAIIVNKDNHLNNISLEDLKKIYKGQLTSWENLEK